MNITILKSNIFLYLMSLGLTLFRTCGKKIYYIVESVVRAIENALIHVEYQLITLHDKGRQIKVFVN